MHEEEQLPEAGTEEQLEGLAAEVRLAAGSVSQGDRSSVMERGVPATVSSVRKERSADTDRRRDVTPGTRRQPRGSATAN